jgi:hypothetical protein
MLVQTHDLLKWVPDSSEYTMLVQTHDTISEKWGSIYSPLQKNQAMQIDAEKLWILVQKRRSK